MDTLQTNPTLASATLNPETPAAPATSRAVQSRSKAERLTATLETLRAVTNDSATLARLAAHGYDNTALAQGMARYLAAQNAYNARQQAMGAKQTLFAEWTQAFARVRADYINFCVLARALFKNNPAARTALGIKGKLPRDFEQFIAHAQATYAAALATPEYLAVLSGRGFTADALEANAAALTAVVDTFTAWRAAYTAAARATAQRNAALYEMENWMQEFRAVLRFAARQQIPAPATPELS